MVDGARWPSGFVIWTLRAQTGARLSRKTRSFREHAQNNACPLAVARTLRSDEVIHVQSWLLQIHALGLLLVAVQGRLPDAADVSKTPKTRLTHISVSSLHDANSLRESTGFHATALTVSR